MEHWSDFEQERVNNKYEATMKEQENAFHELMANGYYKSDDNSVEIDKRELIEELQDSFDQGDSDEPDAFERTLFELLTGDKEKSYAAFNELKGKLVDAANALTEKYIV